MLWGGAGRGKCSKGGWVVLGVVDVDQPPLSGFFPIELSLDAMRGHGRSVLPHRRMESPMEFRPPSIAIHKNLHTMRFKIAHREHSAQYLPEDPLRDNIETVLLAQWIDERDLGRVRPDLQEQAEIHSIRSFGVLLDEVVDRLVITSGGWVSVGD
jgi:hypothetical protein